MKLTEKQIGILYVLVPITIYCVARFCFTPENFKINNAKVIRAKFRASKNTRLTDDGYVNYSYNGYYFENQRSDLACDCFYTGQEILIKIDSLNPESYVFIPDTFINHSVSMPKYDTFVATNFDYYPAAQCLKFDIYNRNGINKDKMRINKLLQDKPTKDTLQFITLNGDVWENFLLER